MGGGTRSIHALQLVRRALSSGWGAGLHFEHIRAHVWVGGALHAHGWVGLSMCNISTLAVRLHAWAVRLHAWAVRLHAWAAPCILTHCHSSHVGGDDLIGGGIMEGGCSAES